MAKVILKKDNKNYVLPVEPTLDLDTNDTNFTNNSSDNESTGSKLDLSNLDWGGIFDGVGNLFTGVGNFTSSITGKGKSDTIYNVYNTGEDQKNNNTGQYVLYGGLILFVVIILFVLLRNK